MGKLIGLQRRGNVWRYRRWVPLNLRDHIGKSELIKSLKTSDYQTAVRRYRTVSRDIEQIITNARDNASTDDFDGSRLIQESDTVELQIKAPPQHDQDGLKTLIKTVVEEVLSVSAPKKPSITLDDLYHRYMDDPARNRSKKTVMTYQSVYNVLMELFGRERLISDIDRADCRRFLEVVRHLPANARKKFPKKSLVEISDIARAKNMKPMAPLTINKYVNKLSAMLNWAVEIRMRKFFLTRLKHQVSQARS